MQELLLQTWTRQYRREGRGRKQRRSSSSTTITDEVDFTITAKLNQRGKQGAPAAGLTGAASTMVIVYVKEMKSRGAEG